MNESGQTGDRDEALEEIFRHASPRPRPRHAARERAYAAVHQAWQEQVGRRRAWRRGLAGLAAVLVAAVAGNLLWTARELPEAPVHAEILRIAGSVRVNGVLVVADTASSPRRLAAGDRMSTAGEARAAIALGGGSLRLDADTVLEVDGNHDVTLLRGRLYFDSLPFAGPGPGPGRIAVATAFGRVTHAGTQFLAAVDDGGLAVSVREGRVEIAGSAGRVAVSSGESVRFVANGGVTRDRTSGHDERWAWAAGIAPEVSLEGRTTGEILGWIARETGRRVRYASTEARQRAASEARGIGALAPMPALRTLPYMTSLAFTLEDGDIVVDVASGNAER